MRRTFLTNLLLSCAICSLAACGGGGGGIGSTPTPPPAPTPTPTPTPSPGYGYIKVFPAITQSTDFAVLGIQQETFNSPAPALVTSGFAVSFDETSGAYVIDLPSSNPGKFLSDDDLPSFWGGSLENSFCCLGVLKPAAAGLSYTSFAQFSAYGFEDTLPAGVVAFGQATPAAAIPTTGSATMDAMVKGFTVDRSGSIGGSATLQFNFGAGTLAGHFDPVLNNGNALALGQYTFVDTVYGVGSTTFSGGFSHANPLLTGAFNGLFTGPSAQELMARWTADYVDPDTQQQGGMFGIWVGRKP
jgi:hypothetical protein